MGADCSRVSALNSRNGVAVAVAARRFASTEPRLAPPSHPPPVSTSNRPTGTDGVCASAAVAMRRAIATPHPRTPAPPHHRTPAPPHHRPPAPPHHRLPAPPHPRLPAPPHRRTSVTWASPQR